MRKLLVILSMVALFVGTACSQKKGETMTAKNHKALVTYFSATGTTRLVAEQLAQVAKADLFEIEPETPYTTADLDWTNEQSRSTVEMKDLTSRPAIKHKATNIADYDVVYIGFPIWWYTAPTIINTFVESHNLSGKAIVFFATSGGSTPAKARQDFKTHYPNLNIVDARLLNNPTDKELKRLVESATR